MDIIFELSDKSRRKIRLTKKQYSHIMKKHSTMANYFEEIKETLINPNAITKSEIDKDVRFYYKYYKYLRVPYNYILVIVKYLNGDGFVISAYFEKNIK